MSKWTNEDAGPRQVKDFNIAMSKLRGEGQAQDELYGVIGGKESKSTTIGMMGPVRAEVAGLLDGIGERYGWKVTRATVRQIIADLEASLPEARKSRPVVDNRRTPEEESGRLAAAAAREAERKAAEDAQNAVLNAVMAKAPANAQALIIAEYHVDDSDIMTDYFNSITKREVAIGFRTGSREDFRQLHAAAASFAETSAITFEEFRENYSMGGGNYLSDHGSSRSGSGWVIKSKPFPCKWVSLTEDAVPEKPAAAPASPAAPAEGVTVRPSSTGRDGFVEVAFAAKPDREVIDGLKAHGFRWARGNACWYGPDAAYAESLTGQPEDTAGVPATDEPAGDTGEQAAEVAGQPADAEDPAPANPEDPDVIIRHTHEDGTLVYGTSKGDGTAEILKANRFRWFPSIKLWGVAQSRDHLAKRWQIDAARKALEAAGFTVAVEIDDTPRDVTQVKADRAERLDGRADRLTAKAQRAAAEGEARRARADQIAQRFEGGQPILVGHHSERGARADQKRIEQNDRAAFAAFDKAKHAAAAASVVGRADAYRELPPVIIRRIDKTEAELRQTQHYIDGTRPANDWRGAYSFDPKPATGAYLEQLQARKTFLEHQLAADRAALAEHEANGYVRLTRETVHKGDRVHWGATWGDGVYGATVTRTNPKTVTLDRRSWPRTLPYEQIKRVECPHEGTETTIRNPKHPARPKPAPVTVERPPEREAPLTVSAGTECFTTPPAIVQLMIDMADLEPGMTVLEPSAGSGAIAGAVHALGCHVDCVELSEDLARVLDAGCYRQVIRADFLEYGPRDNPAGAEYYDRVLMNPPFAGKQDIAHVRHALGFLKPGGLLIAVMAAGVEFRDDRVTAGFRQMVDEAGGFIEPLPEDSFKASGTGVRTVLVAVPAPVAAAIAS